MYLLVAAAVFGLLLLLSTYVHFWSKKARSVAQLPGPTPYPFVGNCFICRNHDLVGVFPDLWNNYGPIFRIWGGPVLLVCFADPEYLEPIMNSNTNITKSFFYDFLKPWLGSGLLTATGDMWRRHRKILTPSFHFKILEEFVDIINRNSDIMIRKLKTRVDGPVFNIYDYITLCSLDIICETAMGVSVNAQEDSESLYVKAVNGMGQTWSERACSPWMFPDFMFHQTSCYRKQRKYLEILHNTTKKVIAERKLGYHDTLKGNAGINEVNDVGQKKRLAFLDLLLQYSMNGANISDQEICDEVDTFMFEGHDTVSAAVSFCVGLLARHMDVQDKVYEEVIAILGDSDRNFTYRELQEMPYLECVIKESLRLYPSVPLFARKLTTDIVIKDLHLTAGTNVGVPTYMLHRNPKYFPDPEKFDPSRFEAENAQGRHPYCYLPFSAGPRNCIGQRFAMNELKCVVSKMIKNFRILPGKKDLRASSDMILRCPDGIIVRLENRI